MTFSTIFLFLAPVDSYHDFLPIGVQVFLCFLFVVFGIAASQVLGPKRLGKNKLSSFECGIEQQGDARQPIAIKYFLVAILFVIFDVEIIFFYPYAVNFEWLGLAGFWKLLVFVIMFLTGYYYVLKKGVMNWED